MDSRDIVGFEGYIFGVDALTQKRLLGLRGEIASRDTGIIVLDLSEVPAIEGGGLGMLLFLQRWASNHDIRLKLFNPRQSVRDRLEHVNSMREFDIATIDELMALLARADRSRSASAAGQSQHEVMTELKKPDKEWGSLVASFHQPVELKSDTCVDEEGRAVHEECYM